MNNYVRLGLTEIVWRATFDLWFGTVSLAVQFIDNDQVNAANTICDFEDVDVEIPNDFTLESGELLEQPAIKFRRQGDPQNKIIGVFGGISAGRIVADCEDENGWWAAITGSGKYLDTNKYCILGFEFAPSIPKCVKTITTKDQARLIEIGLQSIANGQCHAIVGASYGGMVGLAFATMFPSSVEKLFVIAASHKTNPYATAIRGIQRRIVDFARLNERGLEGVSIARQLGMVSYRTGQEFSQRFHNTPAHHAGDPYDVCNYLVARGGAFEMSPERYIALSDSIDRHQIDPSKIRAEASIVAFDSDILVPPGDVQELSQLITSNHRLHQVTSLYGHDGFLKEVDMVGNILKSFLENS